MIKSQNTFIGRNNEVEGKYVLTFKRMGSYKLNK